MFPPPGASTARFTVIVPVKGGPKAKSRLAASFEATGRPRTQAVAAAERLARAFAGDCLAAVDACLSVQRIIVVTSSPDGIDDLPDGTQMLVQGGNGLADAVELGLATAPQGPVAVLLGDLPALTADDLDQALTAVHNELATGSHQAFVPDREGLGTVLLAALSAHGVHAHFGTGSAAAHQRHAARLGLDLPRLRQDVDTLADLIAAAALGCGPRTSALLDELMAKGPATSGLRR